MPNQPITTGLIITPGYPQTQVPLSGISGWNVGSDGLSTNVVGANGTVFSSPAAKLAAQAALTAVGRSAFGIQ
jgi:hypothetical protein